MTLAGFAVLGVFMLAASLWGAVATWRVAASFGGDADVVHWQDGPDLVVMAAPLLAALACFAGPWRRTDRPLLPVVAFAVLTGLIGTGLGKGDALLLDRVAASRGYHYCPALDTWDPHGNRGGGPALTSWGYSRLACPALR